MLRTYATARTVKRIETIWLMLNSALSMLISWARGLRASSSAREPMRGYPSTKREGRSMSLSLFRLAAFIPDRKKADIILQRSRI